jgi:hypothetical protein
MLSKSYQNCTLAPQKVGFLIQSLWGNKVVIKDAKFFADYPKWIDRQLAHYAIEKAFGNQ